MSPVALEMMRMQREDPIKYRRLVAAKAIRNWMKNLRAAKRGEGFFKIDHCEAMLALHIGRYKATE